MTRSVLAAALLAAALGGPWAAPEPCAAGSAAAGARAEGQPRPAAARSVECMTRARPGAPAPVSASVSAYSAEETGGRPTATGRAPRPGIVAVSPDLYAAGWTFGREICVSGHGVFVVGDLMGPGRARAVDIFMDSRARALRFGRRTLPARLLPPGPPGAP